MEKGNTKQEILDAALTLFSTQGFEATSISRIADAVGIRKASLYSHFENIQAILDGIVDVVLDGYAKRSIFALANWDDPEFTKDKQGMTADALVRMIQNQLRYTIHDPAISRSRKMLMIEQFQNAELAKLQTKQNYTDVMRYFSGLARFLIRQGIFAEYDPEIMAAQLCLPITVWINLCDREPEREEDVLVLVEKHIRQFFRLYAVS